MEASAPPHWKEMYAGRLKKKGGGEKGKQTQKNNNITVVSNLHYGCLKEVLLLSGPHACTGVVRDSQDSKGKVKGEVSQFSISEVVCLPQA